MSRRKVECRTFVNAEDGVTAIVIDDRFDLKDAKFAIRSMTLEAKGWFKTYSWKPIAVIPIGERMTPDEAKELAKLLCDTLNANWVKEQLSG